MNITTEIAKRFKQLTADTQQNSKLSSFDRWKLARKDLLSSYDDVDFEEIENKIKLFVLKMFQQRKGDFFYYEDLYKCPELMKFFSIFVISGDRNIGKTTSSKRMALKAVENGGRFIILRNNNLEMKAMARADKNDFLAKNNWNYSAVETPDIYDKDLDQIVGWYRDVNTIGKFKSIEFPDTELIIWEEFNSRVKVSQKFEKAVEFFTTVQRHRQNLKIIMQANYVDQNDEVLQAFGIGLEKITSLDFIKFNWIAGAINIFIPAGVYRSITDKTKALGYRLALLGHDLWGSQFGADFSNEQLDNIINLNRISNIVPVFNIYYNVNNVDKFKFTMYNAYDEDGNPHNLLTTTKGINNQPIFVFDNYNKIKYNNSVLLTPESLAKLIREWQQGKIKTDNTKTHFAIIHLLSIARKILSNKNSVEKIESI